MFEKHLDISHVHKLGHDHAPMTFDLNAAWHHVGDAIEATATASDDLNTVYTSDARESIRRVVLQGR